MQWQDGGVADRLNLALCREHLHWAWEVEGQAQVYRHYQLEMCTKIEHWGFGSGVDGTFEYHRRRRNWGA